MATKTENGEEYPPEAYLYVPDPDKPSTWKLRVWESPSLKVTRRQLGMAAAALGKGFRGNRVDLPPDERKAMARKLVSLYRRIGVPDDEIPPDILRLAGISTSRDDLVEVEATVFKAGEFPDKGLVVTEDDLERLARSADEVPIFVEHKESPVRLGWAERFRREGKYLKATLNFFKNAYTWLRQIGVNGLSVAVSPQLDRLYEVSVVGSPRVNDAFFASNEDERELLTVEGGEVEFPSDPPPIPETNNKDKEEFGMEEQVSKLTEKLALLENELKEKEKELEAEKARRERLEFAIKKKDIEARLDSLIAKGKLPPALREPILEMGVASVLKFSEDEKNPFDDLLNAFDSLPAIVSMGEGEAKRMGNGEGKLSSEEESFLRKMGYTDEEIAEIARLKKEV